MIERVPGEGRYARLEREQRWVLSGLPPEVERPVSITDLYISGTRLRLRRMVREETVVRKLAQKVRPAPADPSLVKLTNVYLSEEEYAVLAALGGAALTKIRWRWPEAGRDLVVDEFGGSLSGLVLAEAELGPDDPHADPPLFALAEVTDDDRFSGGSLSQTSAGQLGRFLADLRTLAGEGGDADEVPG